MDITDIVSTDYTEFDVDTTVSRVVGAFEDPAVRAVLVTRDGEYQGVVTRRQLASSHHPPNEKIGTIVWHVPRVNPREDVREVAALMIESDSHVLPVFDGDRMRGVVTARDLIAAVHDALDAVTVDDAASTDLVTVGPNATFGEAINLLREHRVTHLPVVEGDDAVGILSLYDVVPVTARSETRSQGGSPGEFGGEASHGGFGAREGERERVLDLPVRDVMVTEVHEIRAEAPLDEAVTAMTDAGVSSLVVVSAAGHPSGIVTTTDVLDSLTWGTEGNRAVQVTGSDLMDDMTYEDVVAMVDAFDDRDADMRVLDAKVHLHEHDETRRGTPLLLARIRLSTDRGLYIASGEGYGARHAIGEARDVLERRIRDDRTHGMSKKHPDEEFWERRFGWWLGD